MTPRPKHPKPDANQSDVIADLRAVGFYVQDMSKLGGERLDLLVFKDGVVRPVEVKMPGCEDDLTDGERDGIRYMAEHGVKAIRATCAEDVIAQWPMCAKGDEKRNDSHTSGTEVDGES